MTAMIGPRLRRRFTTGALAGAGGGVDSGALDGATGVGPELADMIPA